MHFSHFAIFLNTRMSHLVSHPMMLSPLRNGQVVENNESSHDKNLIYSMNLKRGLFFDSTGLRPIFWSKMKIDSHGLEIKTPEAEVFPDGSIELETFTSTHFQSSEPSFISFNASNGTSDRGDHRKNVDDIQ